MDPSVPLYLAVLLVVLLVLANGFFVAVEFAMVKARETKLRSPDFYGKMGIRSSLKLLSDLDGSLSATQLGITMASLVLGWWGEQTFQQVFVGWFAWMGEPYSVVASHAMATTLALIVITFLHIVLGELAAKSLAIRYPETTLRLLAWPMLMFTYVCKPAIVVLNGAANLILRLFGIRTPSELEQVHSTAELAMLVAQSSAGGILDKDEEQMLQGVFEFSETVAREVMTPRTDLVTISVEADLPEVLDIMAKTGFSRLPVIGETTDNILGVLVIKDILPYLSSSLSSGNKDFNIKRLMRECYFIPGTKPIDDLLREFKRRKLHIAVVLDEHGGVDGVVTLEDLIEEIVGDIFDESDIPERDIIVRENGDIIVDGGVLVDDLNSRFKLRIPEGDYDTVAGFVLTLLGRVPKQGDQIRLSREGVFVNNVLDPDAFELVKQAGFDDEDESAVGAVVAVQKVTGHRIETLRLRLVEGQTQNLESTAHDSSSHSQEAISQSSE